MATTWFISRDGRQHGPIADLEFRKLIELGQLKATDFVCSEGSSEWMPATRFLEGQTADVTAEVAKPQPASPQNTSENSSSRPSRTASARPARRRLAQLAIGVVLAVFFTIVGRLAADKLYDSLVREKVDRAAVERRLLAHPKSKWLHILRKKQPTIYSQYVDAVTARLQKGELLEDSINYLRKTFVEPIYSANAPYLDDEAMTRYIHLVADQMDQFSQKNPKLCVRMLRGEPLGDVRSYLTETLLARELQLLEDALSADKTKPRGRYTQAEQDRLMGAVVARLAQKHGDLVQLIDPAAAVDGREREVCTVASALFREVASLPRAESAALMRSLLSAPK